MKKINKKKEISIEGLKHFDYKDTELLNTFITPSGQIMGKKRTNLSSKQQRAMTLAIKRSRYMGFMPYIAA